MSSVRVILISCLIFWIMPVNAQAMPDQLVRDTTEKILVLLKKNHAIYKRDNSKLYQMVYEKILPHFDFSAMSRLVLSRNWRSANADQRIRFTKAFEGLLVRTYATALLKYTNQEIIYLPFHAKPTDKKAIVKTEIKSAKGGPNIPLNYSFYNKNGSWKVYDVAIEGISLVTNYRSVYADKVRKQGLDALINSIDKNPGTK
ncbi:MAG: ABC transporter substrate-binding protein [Gammaproteobacteria bacterium]|nr:MAG: ABC transporter substrate-binding protein [Gammaproteobacteria bacterium]